MRRCTAPGGRDAEIVGRGRSKSGEDTPSLGRGRAARQADDRPLLRSGSEGLPDETARRIDSVDPRDRRGPEERLGCAVRGAPTGRPGPLGRAVTALRWCARWARSLSLTADSARSKARRGYANHYANGIRRFGADVEVPTAESPGQTTYPNYRGRRRTTPPRSLNPRVQGSSPWGRTRYSCRSRAISGLPR
jgi:hypothetical protein